MANGFKATTKRINPGWAKELAKRIEKLESKEIVFGFPRGGKAASSTYDNGMSVLDVAVVNQFGADIDHPGGTPYMIGTDGKSVFVKSGSPGSAGLPKTKPHRITIPARPFMDQGAERIMEDVGKDMAALVKDLNRGKKNQDQALKTIGEFGVRCIQEAITDGTYEPNAPSTVRKKGSDKPLMNKNKLRGSVTSAVRDRTD